MFHIHSANHRCTSDLLHHWTVVCISIVSGSINSPSPCWCTLSLLISAHPAISPHSLPSFVVIFFVMLAVVNCNLPVCDLSCSHSLYDTDQLWPELYLSIPSFWMWCFIYTLQVPSFLEKLLLYWWREKIVAAVPNVLVVFYHHNEPRWALVIFLLLHFYCLFLYWLTFTVLMHTVHL